MDEYLQTSVEGIFAAGNVVQVWDLVDNVIILWTVRGQGQMQRGMLPGG